VYSFGVTVAEIFGKHPFEDHPFHGKMEFIQGIKNGTIKPTFPENCPAIGLIIRDCMKIDPAMRPTFQVILSRLTNVSL
jgi:hypothetical protein